MTYRFWARIVTVVAAAITIIIIGLSCAYNARQRRMMENGYEEGTIPGHGSVVWRKVRGQ